MKQHVALITGAVGGIGTILCRVFRSEGYEIVAVDRNEGACDADHFLKLDIRDLYSSEETRRKTNTTIRRICEDRGLKVLINNAAIQILNRTDDVTIADWDETLETNLLAPFVIIQSMLPLIEQARGSVINIGSIHAGVTKPGFVCYATSKAALLGLTRSLAVDLGRRIRVNGINPAATCTPMLLAGFANTPETLKELAAMHPQGTLATPEDIAYAAVFLASDQARFITGSCLNVDGGIGSRLHDPL
jgi:NAD(P)-dependent dehydrogenase (short-subunit alcohol dehydrogenase family)